MNRLNIGSPKGLEFKVNTTVKFKGMYYSHALFFDEVYQILDYRFTCMIYLGGNYDKYE